MPAPAPLGITLRDALPHDADAVARVHVRTWQVAYRGLLPDEYSDSLRPEDRARAYTFGSADPRTPKTLVALDGAEVVGFATLCTDREDPQLGELAALHVEPGHWGRRIGVALIEAARTRLADAGFRAARLWLLEGNQRAEKFYRLDGWETCGMRRTTVVWGVEVMEIGFRRALR